MKPPRRVHESQVNTILLKGALDYLWLNPNNSSCTIHCAGQWTFRRWLFQGLCHFRGLSHYYIPDNQLHANSIYRNAICLPLNKQIMCLSCTKYFVYIGFCFPSFLYDASFLLFFTRNADNGIMIKLVSRVVGGIEGIANTVTFKAENWIVFILFGNKRRNQFVGKKD